MSTDFVAQIKYLLCYDCCYLNSYYQNSYQMMMTYQNYQMNNLLLLSPHDMIIVL